MTRPLLIINADDFGLSPGVNAGIVRAHRDGILTSATILTNAPAFDEAVNLAKANPTLGVGLHLNLVRGRPLSSPSEIPKLVDAAGRLRPFRLARLTGEFLRQAEAEYRRQFERILSAGIKPTHIDFEKHHAWQEPLYRLACRLAGEYGVRSARTLREPVAWAIRRCGWPGASRAAAAAMLRAGVQLGGNRAAARAEGLATPDYFLGQTHIGRMTESVWIALLGNIPAGTVEVMTHPGEAEGEKTTDADGWSVSRLSGRRQELAALLSPAVLSALAESGARPAHFGNLPLAPAGR